MEKGLDKELDKKIATEVMGWEVSYTVGYPEPHTIAYKDEEGNTYKGFSPSSNLNDAWLALDSVCQKNNWRAVIDRNQNQTEINFKNQIGGCIQHYRIAKTATIAICQAVLDSVGVSFDTPA